MTDTEKLRELLAKGTQGKWRTSNKDPVRVVNGSGTYIAFCDPQHKGNPLQENNAALIVAAVNALPELLDELESLRVAGKDALDHGRSLMRLLAHEGGDIVPYLMDTDDNPGQWFRYTLVSLAAALKGNGDD